MYLPRLTSAFVAASEIRNLLDREDVPLTPVAHVDWPASYPYQPEAAVRMALTSDALLIHYHVSEQAVLARFTTDGDRVWTDSCMECFLRPAGSSGYYNIECSCIGTLLVGYGEGRDNREPLSTGLLGSVDRWASLGSRPLGLLNTPTTWDLALAIPYTLFGDDAQKIAAGDFRLNVYKCGDDLPVPHFVSLFPIDSPTPDFHRPDSFQKPQLR